MWKLFCLILVISFVEIISFSIEECKNIKRPEAMYTDCCVYTGPPDNDDAMKKCEANASKDECLADCIFKEKKFLMGNKLDLNAIKTFTKSQLPTIVWDEVIDKSVSNCSSKVADQPLIDNCKTPATQFAMCMLEHLMTNCPASLWNSEAKCTELKKYMDECPATYFSNLSS